MKQELYRKLVAYIVENQDKFYRLAFSYLKNQEDALNSLLDKIILVSYMNILKIIK